MRVFTSITQSVMVSGMLVASCLRSPVPNASPAPAAAARHGFSVVENERLQPSRRTAEGDAWFRGELDRLGAVPIIVAVKNDEGVPRYLAGVDSAVELIARHQQTTLVLVRDRELGTAAYRSLSEPTIHPLLNLRASELPDFKSPHVTVDLLGFDARAPIDFAPSEHISLPPEIVARDFPLEPGERLDTAQCQPTLSGRHCLAAYSARQSPMGWRTQLVLYDQRWQALGRTEETLVTANAHARARGRARVDDLFEVRGLPLPIFVDSLIDKESQPPCFGFSLTTFTTNGDVAEAFFPTYCRPFMAPGATGMGARSTRPNAHCQFHCDTVQATN